MTSNISIVTPVHDACLNENDSEKSDYNFEVVSSSSIPTADYDVQVNDWN